MRTPFTGLGTALVTPFRKDGSLDEAAVRRLVRRQIDAGVHFVSPCGTTGEAPTLSHSEKIRVVQLVVDEAAGRVPVLAGAGGYDTREVIELAREYERIGVDGILSVTPYYNKPTQEGLFQHYKAIAESTRAADRALQRARAHRRQPRAGDRRFVSPRSAPSSAIKEASGNLVQMSEIVASVPRRVLPAERRRSDCRGGDVGRRPRPDLGGVQRRARRDGADHRARREGRFRRRAKAAPLAAAVPPGELRRVEPDSGEGGDGGDGAARRDAIACRSCRPATPRATGS